MNHPKWGNSRDCQISASYVTTIEVEVEVSAVTWFGGGRICKEKQSRQVRLSTVNGQTVPDDAFGQREFKYRCGLIKAINVLAGSRSRVTLYLDGFSNVAIDIGNTEFVFDDQLEEPVAEITFSGECTRYGVMPSGRTDNFVTMIFKDKEQMMEYFVATVSHPDSDKQVVRKNSSDPRRVRRSYWPFSY